MGQKRQYFVCKCGAWTWADKVHSSPYCQCGKKWPAPALKQNGSPRPPKSDWHVLYPGRGAHSLGELELGLFHRVLCLVDLLGCLLELLQLKAAGAGLGEILVGLHGLFPRRRLRTSGCLHQCRADVLRQVILALYQQAQERVGLGLDRIDKKERREEERRLKRAVTTIWDQIPEDARARLTQAGWKGPPKQKDAVESQTDPLLSLLVQRQDDLPEDIRTALVEATTGPEPSPGEKAMQSNKNLTKASSRLRVLIHKKIKLLESIEEAKESLRLQLQELQETTEKIHEAENAVEKAKLELTKAVGTPTGVQDVPVTPEPMDVDELVTILGLTLSDEQQEKLAEYRAKTHKRQRPSEVGAPPGLPAFHLGLQGTQPTTYRASTPAGRTRRPGRSVQGG
ncbi:unnamed protein product [Symbiodinium sp. CCMP2592]|nr:unnamed protein product [Symbiodinium sp. CCMP2592]